MITRCITIFESELLFDPLDEVERAKNAGYDSSDSQDNFKIESMSILVFPWKDLDYSMSIPPLLGELF